MWEVTDGGLSPWESSEVGLRRQTRAVIFHVFRGMLNALPSARLRQAGAALRQQPLWVSCPGEREGGRSSEGACVVSLDAGQPLYIAVAGLLASTPPVIKPQSLLG